MENTNAICKFYDNVNYGDGSTNHFSYNNQFDGIAIKVNEAGNPYIGGFYIVTELNFLGTTKEENKVNNVVMSKIPVQCQIKMTRFSGAPEERLSWVLDEFTIDPKKDGVYRTTACVPTLDYTRITPIDQLILTPDLAAGDYDVKVLLKPQKKPVQSSDGKDDKNDIPSEDIKAKWIVQTISHLKVIYLQ